MAGFTQNHVTDSEYQFYIDTPNVAERIRAAANGKRVLTLQLDGDELDAALWGLQNFKKGVKLVVSHARDCPCSVEDCWAAPSLTSIKEA